MQNHQIKKCKHCSPHNSHKQTGNQLCDPNKSNPNHKNTEDEGSAGGFKESTGGKEKQA